MNCSYGCQNRFVQNFVISGNDWSGKLKWAECSQKHKKICKLYLLNTFLVFKLRSLQMILIIYILNKVIFTYLSLICCYSSIWEDITVCLVSHERKNYILYNELHLFDKKKSEDISITKFLYFFLCIGRHSINTRL